MTIIQQPDSLSFSLNLKPIKINTAVDVAFILTQDGKTVLSETLSPDASDMVEVSLRDIIHGRLSTVVPPTSEPFEQPGSASDFTVAIGSESFSFRVIRGGVDRPSDVPSAFARANFLTWQPTLKRVTYSSPEYLSYYAVDNGCAVKVRAFFTDGETVSSQEKELCTLSRGVVTTFSVQYAVISGLFSSRLPAYYDVWVANGSTSLTYTQRYVADIAGSLDEDWFIFENSLGGIDSFRAYGPLDLAYRHEHNLAEMDDTVLEYRVDTERLMTKSTGRLSRGEAAWMADFFPSVGKYICLGGSVRRISVTDSSVSGKVRTEPVSFSFTFRIADALPLLNLPRHDLPIEMLGLTVPDVGSFTLPPRLLEFPRQPLSEGVLFPVQEPYSEEWAVTTLGGIAEYVKGKIDIPSPGLDRADLFGILGGKPRAGERINPEFIDLSGYLTPDILGHYATFADLVRSVNNKLDTQFFASVFTVYDEDGNPIVPNTYEQVAENLQVMVGAWTERYLSALGKNPDEEEGGGGVSGIDPVEMWKLLGGAYQTNEVIGVSHIPGLPADKITSGIFSIDRIPNIPLAKIPDLQQTLQQLRSDVNAKLDTRFFASVFTVYDEDGNPIVPNTYEQAAENLQVMVGAWTERYLSALGKNDDESGGGGMSPEELWTELGSSPWTDRQISADHLTDALAGYVKKISFGSKDYAAVSGTVTIPVISNNPTLAFGAAAEILKLGDTSVKVTMPAANITEGTITIGSNSIKPLTGITSKHVTDALGYTPADVNELLKYYTKTEVNAFTWWGQKLNDSGVVSGDMTMNNGDAIIWKSPSGNAVATQSVLTLNSSNNVHLGSTDKASTHNTYINGVNIYLRTAATGTARGNRVTISSSGAVTIAKTLAVTGATTLTGLLTANGGITIPSGKTLQIGGATLSWDSTNNMLKVDTGFYSEKSVSALGANDDSGSGGGELDEGKMWGYLGGSMDNKVISLSHIPELETLTFSYGSVASASGSITYNGHTAKTVVIPNTLDHIADGTTRKLPVIAYKDKKFTLNNSDLVSAATIVSDGGGIKTIKINGTAQAVTNNAVNLPAYPTLKGLMGSTPIGAAKTPIYWDGSGFKAGTQIKDLAYKDSLAFSEITDKPTTLSGYGITDAYTESEIDTKVTAINESIGNKADKTINISAGNGLQGGGDLTEDRTLSIKLQSNSGLTVASAGLKLDIINNLTTANAYKAISATQAKKIWDLLNQMFTLENTGTSSAPVYRIKANYGLYSEQYISALGANGDSGSGVVDRAQVFGYLSDNGTEQIGKTHLTSALAGYLDGVTVSTVDGATVVTDVKQNGTKVVVTKSKVAFSDYAKKDDLDNYFALYGGTNLTPTSTTTVNLDTIKAAGSYYCALNANAKNVDGRPATGHNVAFRLWVVATTGTSTNYVRQIFSEFSTNKVYERYFYQSSGTWSDWELTGDELSAYIRGIANTANANTLTITKGDGTTSTLTVGYATKAAQDGNGNNIVETYATKTSLEGATGDISTLKSYFTNGVANSAASAAKLTTVSKTAWGQTYWTSGGVPESISGDMTGVGKIVATGNIESTRNSDGGIHVKVANTNGSVRLLTNVNRGVYDDTAKAWVIGTDGTHTFLMDGDVGIGTSSPAFKLDVNGNTQSKTYTISSTSAERHLVFKRTDYNYISAPANADISFEFNKETLSHGNVAVTIKDTGLIIPSNRSLKIGDCTIKYENGMLHFDKGIYSDGAVSALGANGDTSGGGELDEGKMWEYLGGSMNNKVIALSHIPDLATLTFSYGSVASASGSTYNGHTARTVVIPKSLSHLTNDINAATLDELNVGSVTEKRFVTPSVLKQWLDGKSFGTVKKIKVGTGSEKTPDANGVVTLDAYPTLKGLMGSTAIGADNTPIYWNGSAFKAGTQLKAIAYKDSLAFSEITGEIAENQLPNLSSTYVTLSGVQTIKGKKTFSAQQAFTVAQGTSPFTVTSNTLVANLNADLLDGYHATSFTKRVSLNGGTNYRRIVIALCQLTDANVSAGTHSNGRITFHRTTGFHQDIYADVAFNAKYAGADTLYCCITSNARNFSTAPVTGSGVRPCRFTYGGKQYGGVEFFYSSAQHEHMAFYGETNFDIFLVDYYDTKNEVAVNTEIYNSIDYTIDSATAISTAGDYLDAYRLRIGGTATIAGLLTANGSVYIPTGKYLRIGEAYLTYDTSAKMIKVWDNAGNEVRGIYATGALSSLGANTDTSGGGVVDEEQVWGYLASSDASKKIHSSHIDYEVGVNGNALTGISVSNGGKLSFSKGYFVNAVQSVGTGDVITGYNLSNGTLTLTKGSITTIPYLKVNDVRGTDHLPNSEVFPVKSVTAFFNNTKMPKSGWHSGLTVKGWTNDYQSWQIVSRSHNDDTTSYLYYRIGRGDTWESWRTILDTKNYKSYTYSKTDERTKNYVLAAPNGKDGAAVFRALVADDIPSLSASKITSGTFDTARIPDLSSTYAKASDVSTLQSYFTTNGVANVAAKLNTGTTTYSAWGQTYWQNGVPNSVSGDMTSVEKITFNKAASGRQLSISKGGMVSFNAASAGGWAWGLASHTNDSSAEIGWIGFLGDGDAVYYAFVGGTYNSPHLVVMGNKDSGKEGYVGIGTKSPVMTLHVEGTLGVTEDTTLLGLLTANGGITIPANKTLKIGSITLTDDNGLLKIDKGVYSLGTVSSLGANTDTSGGGTGFDESDMWEWLGGSMTNKKIDNSHLNFTIGDYLKKSITNDTQTAAANQEVVVGIEYNGSTGGLTVKKSAVTLSNYLPLSAGSGNALTGNLCFGNNLGIFMKNSAGLNCQVFVLNSSSNSLHLGGSANAAGFDTYVSGKNVYLRYVKTNDTFGTGLSIDQSGLVTIAKDLTVSGTTTLTGAVTASSSVTASSFIKSGGTSSQFLKADGSVDSNTYATTSSLGSYLPLSAGANHPLTGHLYMGVARTTTDATYNDSEQRIYGRRGNDNLTTYFLRSRSRENKSTGVLSEYIYLGFVQSATIAYATVATGTQGWTTLSLGNTWLKESHENSMAGIIYLYAPQAEGATTVYSARITPGVLTANRTQTLPNITGTFIMDAGAQTITGVKTFSNGLTAAGVNTGFIEMKPTGRTGDGGYIDFHYNNSDADFTSRIIEDSSSHLHIYADSGVYISGYVTSANEVTASSDERLKNIAGDIRLSVKDIASAPSVYFYWKDGRDKKKHIGSIAQYWGKVLPESVSYDGQGYMSLNYQSAALVAAIAIARAVSEHESRLTKLERENKALKKRITKLETELEERRA